LVCCAVAVPVVLTWHYKSSIALPKRFTLNNILLPLILHLTMHISECVLKSVSTRMGVKVWHVGKWIACLKRRGAVQLVLSTLVYEFGVSIVRRG
jgi:hypothetical protein